MSLVINPIGFIHSKQIEPYQAGRQPDSLSQSATLILQPKNNFEQALQDLEGCSHIWLIFGFHQNTHWKPLVQTPRSDRKIGVFATRAPYRPNPIGLSCVQLISVKKLTLEIGGNDLLDGTPVYDIKPYHPEVDSHPEAQVRWLTVDTVQKIKITFSPSANDEFDFLDLHGLSEVKSFCLRQLEYDPINHHKKRVEKNNHTNNCTWTLSYRTWRIDFLLIDNTLGILSVRSGYSSEDLLDKDDPYSDKKIHHKFNQHFKRK